MAIAILRTNSRRIPSSSNRLGSRRTIPTKVVFIAKIPSVNVETDSVSLAICDYIMGISTLLILVNELLVISAPEIADRVERSP